MPYKNIEDRIEHHRKYIKKYRQSSENREKEKIQCKIYRESHKQYQKDYYETHKNNPVILEKRKNINAKKRKLHAENPQILKDDYKKSKKEICILCGEPARKKYCSKKCMGLNMEGETNRFYCGGNREGYPKEWNIRFRKSIRERDKFNCMKCGVRQLDLTEALNVHHIDGIKKNTDKENCISFCTTCHAIIETRPEEEKKNNIKKYHQLLKELYGY